jgi:ADP-ribosylglycohydrolase
MAIQTHPAKKRALTRRIQACWLSVLLLLAALRLASPPTPAHLLPAEVYLDKVYGAWKAIMIANHTGLEHQGTYLEHPSDADRVEPLLLDQWSTDDDTAIEWVDLHILETYGLEPSYAQIRDEWVAHLNHDLWVATLRARQLMDQGVLPPDTGSAALNPDGAWSIDAQLQTELFGLIAPGLPHEAFRRATTFARVTNSGPAVQASGFYATLYALAFFEEDIPTLIRMTQSHLPSDAQVKRIADDVLGWHRDYPRDWRTTRRLIRDAYDTDPEWWASRVNFASTLMALLYGDGDVLQTLDIAIRAGWDADNNATTSVGLLGLIHGFSGLPEVFQSATDTYFNEDVTGELPRYQTVHEIAVRTAALAEAVVQQAGGSIRDGIYIIPREQSNAGASYVPGSDGF